MNYHESGKTISKEYFALLHNLTERFFPHGNREPVTLSGLTEEEARECVVVMTQPMAQNWDLPDNWPIHFCRRLHDQWQTWSEAPNDLVRFQQNNAKLYCPAAYWCKQNNLHVAQSIEPGPPWHMPFLCLFAYAAEKEVGGGDGGYYQVVGRLFDTRVDGAVVRDQNQEWSRLWTSVANWARRSERGFMVAEIPENFAYVGWPQQHALLSMAERRELCRWLRNGCLRTPGQGELRVWLGGFSEPSVQLERILREDNGNRLRLLTDWAKKYFESVQQRLDEEDDDDAEEQVAEAQAQRGGGGRSNGGQANTTALVRARLIIELSGQKVESVCLEPTVEIESRQVGDLELGGERRFLRASGDWRPAQLRTMVGLLGEDGEFKRQLEALQVRWPERESRLFVGEGGVWLQYPLSGRELDTNDEVLVLCRAGQSRQWVDGESGRVDGLHHAYELHRCRASALNRAAWGKLLDRPEGGQVATIKFEGGIRRSRWSQREYFGVALPRVSGGLAGLKIGPDELATLANDGALAIRPGRPGEDVSEAIKLKLTSPTGHEQELLACFPKTTQNDRFDDAAFEDLPTRVQTDEVWLDAASFELNPQRRFVAVTDGTISLGVAKSRQEVIWSRESEVLPDDKRIYWVSDLADMGHLKLGTSDSGMGTWITASEARVEVLADVGDGMCGPYLGRMVGAHDWVRVRGCTCEGVEWCEVDSKFGRSEILVRGSKSALRSLGCMLGVPIVPCLRPSGALEFSTAPLNEFEGFPWNDQQEIRNPLDPHVPLPVAEVKLKSLVGSGGTLVVSQAIGDYAKEHYRLRFDGRRWYRSPLHVRSVSGHYWESVRSGWARYGRIMTGSALALPLPYDASTQTLYFQTKLKPPADIREALCSMSGRSPTIVGACLLRSQRWAAWRVDKPFAQIHEQGTWMIGYRFISPVQAEAIASALGARLASSE